VIVVVVSRDAIGVEGYCSCTAVSAAERKLVTAPVSCADVVTP